MSRRPIETGGSLVFQEGKKIEGEYYIIAVYDDPERNTVSFSAYELETNQTYTLPYTYSELDELFRYNSELMNPTNRDARYHWIIERLDFVVALDSTTGGRKLCLAPEPTPEEDHGDKKKKTKQDLGGGGKLDAATRAKLIAELDTMDDHALYISLVKSEDARQQFLTALHSKRRLEQIKAIQRSHKLDEDQEQRVKKLQQQRDFIKQKAMNYTDEQNTKKANLQKMAELMNEAENEAVAKALKKKAAKQQQRQDWRANRAKDREREAQREKRRREQELERWKQLDKRRKLVQEERDMVLHEQQEQILKKRQIALDGRMKLRQQKKGNAMAAKEKAEAARQKLLDEQAKRKEHFRLLDEKRIHSELERERKRNIDIRDTCLEMKKEWEEIELDKKEYKDRIIEELHASAALAARKRAMDKLKKHEDLEKREAKAVQRQAEREKKVKEMDWLRKHDDQAEKDVLQDDKDDEDVPIEDEEILRLKLEDRARVKRKEERDAVKKKEENKLSKIDSLFSSQKQRNIAEGKKAQIRREMEQNMQITKERQRVALAEEAMKERIRSENEKIRNIQLSQKLELIRRKNDLGREERLLAETLKKARSQPIGSCMSISFFPFF